MMYLIIKKNKSKIKCKTNISLFIISKNEMVVVYLHWLTAMTMGVYTILSMMI